MLPQAAEMYRAMEQAGAIRMSVVGYGTPEIPCDDGPIPTVGVVCRGNKIFLDGSPQQRTAFLREPYVGGSLGEATMTEAEVLDAVRTAKEQNRQILAHCNGDAAIDRFLWALEKADYPPALRPVVIHAQLLRLDQMKKVKERGAVLSFFVSHTRHWGDDHLKNLGDRAMTISPCRSTLDRGIPFTLHQDTPVLPPTPFEPVACAALRQTGDGVQLAKGERISIYEGLRAMTAGAAYQYRAEADRGTLEVGKRADLIILDRDPFGLPAEELEEIRVLETISAGETLWSADR